MDVHGLLAANGWCFEDASCRHETPRLIDGTSPEENRPLGPGLAHPAPQFLIRWRHVLSLHDPQSRTDLDANSRWVDEVLPLLKGPVKFCLQVGPTSSCNETWARARRNPRGQCLDNYIHKQVGCMVQFKLTNLKCLSLKTGHMPKNSGTSPVQRMCGLAWFRPICIIIPRRATDHRDEWVSKFRGFSPYF